MWWRAKVIQWTVLSAAIASVIVLILVTFMLLPSITDGPDAVHYLERTQCVLLNITYESNKCPRDTLNDFSNLIYLDDWQECKIVKFDIINELGLNCSWYHPGSYENEKEAFIAISENYEIGMKYKCVLDAIKNVCYPDKREVLIFSLSVSSLFVLTILILAVFCYLRIWTT